ncbi:MAG: C40 family peptidase [Lachnospiraceae bacterium]|nr:C40 family peptidase [Lachnospiraceae bacterium]
MKRLNVLGRIGIVSVMALAIMGMACAAGAKDEAMAATVASQDDSVAMADIDGLDKDTVKEGSNVLPKIEIIFKETTSEATEDVESDTITTDDAIIGDEDEVDENAVTDSKAEDVSDDVTAADEDMNEANTEAVDEEKTPVTGLAIAICDSYVNVRSIPSTDGKILGKIYKHGMADVIEEADGWYKMTSGEVTGYIKADYFVVGEEAQELVESLNARIAKVKASALRVRASQSTDAEVLALLSKGTSCVVLFEEDEWVKVKFGDVIGWVAKEYVDISLKLNNAISIEEEARQKEAARKAEEEKKNQIKTQAENLVQLSNAEMSEEEAALREKIVAFALQYVGNKYVYGGNSLTNGTDCSGFVKLIYQEFGYTITRRASTQYGDGTKINWQDARPGDLIFYGKNSITHVVMYIGNGKVVHASTPETGIIVSGLNYKNIYGATRIIK